jgi:hypothetical protein
MEVCDQYTNSDYRWKLPIKYLQGEFRCKNCKGDRNHFVAHYFNNKFLVHTCAFCQSSSTITYENVKLCKILLVCVELNPGPKRKADEVALIVNKRRKTHKKNGGQSKASKTGLSKTLRQEEFGLGPVSKSYIEMLCDPIHSAPLASGFMTWVATVLQSAYVKGTLTLGNDGLILLVNPDASLSTNTGTVTSNFLNNYLTIEQINGSSLVSATAFPATNRANINAAINTNRVLASGLEIQISHAATAQSGVISVTRLNGLTGVNNLDVTGTSAYQSLPQSAIYTTQNGSATINVNWLPADATDFEFANNTVFNNGEGLLNPYLISLAGFPSGTRVFYEVMTHLEGETALQTTGGVALDEKAGPAAQSPSYEPALIDEHASADSFMRKSSQVLSVASQKMQYAPGESNIIEDIVNTAAKGVEAAKRAWNSPLTRKVRGAVNTFFETGDKISSKLEKFIR